VNPLAAGDGGTSRITSPLSRSAAGAAGNLTGSGYATEETTMRYALLYYLAQSWTADRYRPTQRDVPDRAANRAYPPRRSPRAHRTRGLPAEVARRLRTVLGGSP